MGDETRELISEAERMAKRPGNGQPTQDTRELVQDTEKLLGRRPKPPWGRILLAALFVVAAVIAAIRLLS